MRKLQDQITAYRRHRDRKSRKQLEGLPKYIGMEREVPQERLELTLQKMAKTERDFITVMMGNKTYTDFYTKQLFYQQQTEKVTTLPAFLSSISPDKVYSQASVVSKRTQKREKLLTTGED